MKYLGGTDSAECGHICQTEMGLLGDELETCRDNCRIQKAVPPYECKPEETKEQAGVRITEQVSPTVTKTGINVTMIAITAAAVIGGYFLLRK